MISRACRDVELEKRTCSHPRVCPICLVSRLRLIATCRCRGIPPTKYLRSPRHFEGIESNSSSGHAKTSNVAFTVFSSTTHFRIRRNINIIHVVRYLQLFVAICESFRYRKVESLRIKYRANFSSDGIKRLSKLCTRYKLVLKKKLISLRATSQPTFSMIHRHISRSYQWNCAHTYVKICLRVHAIYF